MKGQSMISQSLKEAIGVEIAEYAGDDQAIISWCESLREHIHKEISPVSTQPVDRVRWVPVDKVSANDYNPNAVARTEMRLLYTSILHDGYTQPVVTVHDEDSDTYVIVDGFHRYLTCATNEDIRDRNHGMLPVVVINKSINDRMASTVRHNRARGKHSIKGMASIVFSMLDEGWDDIHICNELGMEPDELVRLKHVTGFSKLFKDSDYAKAWVTKNQIKARKEYKNGDSEKEAQ